MKIRLAKKIMKANILDGKIGIGIVSMTYTV